MQSLSQETVLGRAMRVIDLAPARAYFADKRVLITGAAGSVGAALAHELAEIGCAALILADRYDHGLIEVMESVAATAPDLELIELLSDIRELERLKRAFARAKPDVVIHAAALKHVHLGERHPSECVLTNLIGVRNTVEASEYAGASQFILVSSDKAAAPACVMGASKRLAEMYLTGRQRDAANCVALKSVRFGNVYASQGSVVPRFVSQIAKGGPVEVTHAGMERYFMSAQEAVRLILTVAASDEPDRAASYYLDMGEPVRIVDLAERLIAAKGSQAQIVFTGLRPGEKLTEALFDATEEAAYTRTEGVLKITSLSRRAFVTGEELARLEGLAGRADEALLRRQLFNLLEERIGAASKVAV